MARSLLKSFAPAAAVAALLAGCTPQETVVPSSTFPLASGLSAEGAIAQVSRNAGRIGADVTGAGASGAVVTYSGLPRDYVVCTTGGVSVPSDAWIRGGGVDASQRIRIDTRTRVVPGGSGLAMDSLYLATISRTTAGGQQTVETIAFDLSGGGETPTGTACRATGHLERSLAGLGTP